MRLNEPPLELLVRILEVHQPLGTADKAAIVALPYHIKTVEAQSYLVREGDVPDRCAVLLEGFAVRHKLTGDGSRQILSVNIPGEAIDFQNLFLRESDHNVQLLTRGIVASVPMLAVEQLALSHSGAARAILTMIQVESSTFREWAVNIGRRDARSRIAHLLCEFAYRMSAAGLTRGDHYELPMTQEQLADATGLTAVHVNRVLQALQREGMIERDRRMIRFPSWERMRDVGDFNARYLYSRELPPQDIHLDQSRAS